MVERPILFDAESMLSFLAGEKTRTSRPIVNESGCPDFFYINPDGSYPYYYRRRDALWDSFGTMEALVAAHCPYGVPGDSLWARESWQLDRILGWPSWRKVGRYLADGAKWSVQMSRDLTVMHTIGTHPSIFMPREISRLDCGLLEVNVQQIQSMTPAEITAEGIPLMDFYEEGQPAGAARALQLEAWIARWNGINADRGYAYDSNPWVWALTLRPRFRM